MRTRRLLLCGGVWLAVASGWCAAQQVRTELPEELKIVPDMKPMPSLEVVTVRKAEPNPSPTLLKTRMKSYLLGAYGITDVRLVGGPSWLADQWWVINGKNSDELNAQLKTMTKEQQFLVGQMLKRSVLADQFKLKAHVETRQMQYYELRPAKGGIKIKEVEAAAPAAPGAPMPPPPSGPGRPLPPGMLLIGVRDGKTVVNGRAVTVRSLMGLMSSNQEVGGRPIVDKTGFKGSFDLKDMEWAGAPGMVVMNGGAPPPAPTDVDAPSMFTAVEETLGMKLAPVKGPVEVLVIDSITEPTEN